MTRNPPSDYPSQVADRGMLASRDIGLGNLVIQMELEFNGAVDFDRLSKAADLLLEAEPILNCRIDFHGRNPHWQTLSTKAREISSLANEEVEYDRFRSDAIDPRMGPQIKVCLWRRSQGDRLLLKVAHEVSDAGGVKQLTASLAAIYRRLADEPGYRPEPNRHGSRGPWQVLRFLPWSRYPRMFLLFLQDLQSNFMHRSTHMLQLSNQPDRQPVYIIHHLNSNRTASLAEYGRGFQATLNDLMLAACYRALAKQGNWNGNSELRLQMTIDMRRYLPGGRAQAVCNLSSFAYPYLGAELGDTFEATLRRVSSITRNLKANRIGMPYWLMMPVMGLTSYQALKKALDATIHPPGKESNYPPVFTNMGPIKSEGVAFGDQVPVKAWLMAPSFNPPVITIGLSGYKGSLTISAGVPQSSRQIIESLFGNLLSELPA